MKFIKQIGIFFGVFMLYHILFSSLFPTDENNVLQAPDWYMYLGFAISIGATVFFTRKKRTSKKIARNKFKDGIIPRSEKAQVELANEILLDTQVNVELMNKATSVSLFISWYDMSLNNFETLAKLTKVKYESHPQLDLYRLKNEFQWHLCDTIVRAKENAISEIKGKYRNSKEFQIKTADDFERDITTNLSRFSKGTSELAVSAIEEVNNLVAANRADDSKRQFSEHVAFQADILSIDLMEGHEFEYWCASLLRKIGFQKVEVTQASGDDGVDIIAEKEGIRYAIQCKRYNSDLGNKPVQEVHTGKSVYNCHVGAVMTNRYFTAGGKKAAEATGTLLWDRTWIMNMLNELAGK